MSTSPSPTLSNRTRDSVPVATLKSLGAQHKKAADECSEEIVPLYVGADDNKKRKNKKSCSRGNHTVTARFGCSADIRSVYPQDIIGDDAVAEHCVVARDDAFNSAHCPCSLCFVHLSDDFTEETETVNVTNAVGKALNGNVHRDVMYDTRMRCLIEKIVDSKYPDEKRSTTLRITVDGQVWIEYYVKLMSKSTMLKAISPSGYNYKYKNGLAEEIRCQGATNKKLVFCLLKDQSADSDGDHPMRNCIGFGPLTKRAQPGDIRTLLQLNKERALDVGFKFMIHKDSNIRSIKVDLVCTIPELKMVDKEISLWSYPRAMSPMMDHTDSSDSSASLSPVASRAPMSNPLPIPATFLGHPPSIPMADPQNYKDFSPIPPLVQSVIPNQYPFPDAQQVPFTAPSQSVQEQPQLDYTNHLQFEGSVQPQNPLPLPLIPAMAAPTSSISLGGDYEMGLLRQNTMSLPPLPSPIPSNQLLFSHQSDAMTQMSVDPRDQMRLDNSSMAPSYIGNRCIDFDALSSVGGYGGVHHGFNPVPRFNPLGSGTQGHDLSGHGQSTPSYFGNFNQSTH